MKKLRQLLALGLLAAALIPLANCGDSAAGPSDTPSPSPSASASPTPAPVNLCEISRTSITFERMDGQFRGDIVTSWPRGTIPVAHARPVYANQGHPDFDADACQAFDRVRWWCAGASACEFIGDQTAPDIYIKINQGGFHCIRAQALDLTEFGEACVSVVG